MELPLEVCDLRFVQWPGFGKHRLELLGPHDGHVVDGERAAEQRPVRVNETQHSPYRHLWPLGQGGPD